MARQEEKEDLTRRLPDDVLANVLGRLGPRDLAVSRCLRRAWRALIDDRGLLRADLLPRSLAALVIKYSEGVAADLFARPASAKKLTAGCCCRCRLYHLRDHCNGLVLQASHVVNPATGQRAPLPQCPPPRSGMDHYWQDMYLVFDPTVSLHHYEVFSIPRVPATREESDDGEDEVEPEWWPHCIPDLKELPFCSPEVDEHVDSGTAATLQPEWPPSPFILNVFSSTSRRWETRSFDREGEAAGTVADMELVPQWVQHRHAVYWRGALYVHSESDFVTKISLSNNRYQVIKPPRGIEMCEYRELHLGKSEKGVYYALLYNGHLRVWTLGESCDQKEWILKYYSSGLVLQSLNCVQQVYGPWILQEYNNFEGYGNEALEEHKLEWDSDDGNIVHTEDRTERSREYLGILGFHPYKEIIFLHRSLSRGLAFHLNSSKLEDLGNLGPDSLLPNSYIDICFPYTPCWIDI